MFRESKLDLADGALLPTHFCIDSQENAWKACPPNMSAKAVSEWSGKRLLYKHMTCPQLISSPIARVNQDTNWNQLTSDNPWMQNGRLVAKPDQLIKRRGKLGLIKVGAPLPEIQQWINERMNKDVDVNGCVGKLRNFVVEPCIDHNGDEEAYVCIHSHRHADTILFTPQGGVDIGDVDAKALKLDIPISDVDQDKAVTKDMIKKSLLGGLPQEKQEFVSGFILDLYRVYVTQFFTYLEINPLVITKDRVYILDLAAKLDATADFMCKGSWGQIEFPPPFGRDSLPEEAYIADLDSKSGASLKLTILNKQARVWTMVAGGGASVIYSDTICDLISANELANYGEYSGAPSETQTYEYAKTILSLMTQGDVNPQGKVLIIGGSIANFTNVAATFKGIVKALKEFQTNIKLHNIGIFVRRGGPNYQEGLRVMRETGEALDLKIFVFGPETHMTAVVGMALGKQPIPAFGPQPASTGSFLLQSAVQTQYSPKERDGLENGASGEPMDVSSPESKRRRINATGEASPLPSRKEVKPNGQLASNGPSTHSATVENTGKDVVLFKPTTKGIVWGMQLRAVQSMLDFDYACARSSPSVAAMTYPLTGDHKQMFYFGHKEIFIPVYKDMSVAFEKHQDASVLVSFASLRSAYESTLEALKCPRIRTIAIIAEGIPENMTRRIIREADKQGVTIIGPATVGGVKPGAFKIGNTGGMMDNIISAKLYRPGSVAYVSRSGGMSNELNNIIGSNTDGVNEGVAIGGDRYPSTTFMDHLLRYEANPDVKMVVMLGEVGGVEEYEVCEALKSGRLSKPLVAWCIGTCAGMFKSEVQFGHAGACANAERETAVVKNKALRAAGATVPSSFDDLGHVIRDVYVGLVNNGVIEEHEEKPPPAVPMDYNWARELGLIRKPASFMSSICDERGNEVLYAGVPIQTIIKDDMGLGGVLSLLWFQRKLPPYASKFIELCLMLTADHGPAVSGAHNTIVCARAGKDLISSLASGLLTIGDRFGGALDGAARQFSTAYDMGLNPMEFVTSTRKEGKLIMGIGHRVKSINNPDMRVTLLLDFARKHFPSTTLLNYATEVEKITTSKKPNLILNVDGGIGVCMVDLLRDSGCFTAEEARQYVEIGTLNGLFVLGRSMGFIGHFLDQKRLQQGLYRHPWDDISYVMPEINN